MATWCSVMVLSGCPAVKGAGQLVEQGARVPQSSLVYWLEQETQAEREALVAHVRRLPAGERGAEVEQALAAELSRLNGERRRRLAAEASGTAFREDFPAEYHAAPIEVVGGSTDPAVIPSLVEALDTGWMVRRALARFGEAAVPPVLDVARGRGPDGSEASAEMVTGALSTLQLILEARAGRLRPLLEADIVEAVHHLLSGRQHWTVLRAACGVALATGDTHLKTRADRLAHDPRAVAGLGVTDPRWIAMVQQACRAAGAATVTRIQPVFSGAWQPSSVMNRRAVLGPSWQGPWIALSDALARSDPD